jgi:hypothetical protein
MPEATKLLGDLIMFCVSLLMLPFLQTLCFGGWVASLAHLSASDALLTRVLACFPHLLSSCMRFALESELGLKATKLLGELKHCKHVELFTQMVS